MGFMGLAGVPAGARRAEWPAQTGLMARQHAAQGAEDLPQ